MEILYKIGDHIRFPYKYENDEGDWVTVTVTGYIFAIEITQEGVFGGKKGYAVRYKVDKEFAGIHGNWRYAQQEHITKLGSHEKAGSYENLV